MDESPLKGPRITEELASHRAASEKRIRIVIRIRITTSETLKSQS